MSTATQRRPHTSAPTDGSRTITLQDVQSHQEDHAGDGGPRHSPSSSSPFPSGEHASITANATTVGVLRLRGTAPPPQRRDARPRVAWDAGVVDNEGCGRKKSKICCIYHKPRRFNESSSSESNSSDSDSSDSGPGSGSGSGSSGLANDRARPTTTTTKRCRHRHHHAPGGGGQRSAGRRDGIGVLENSDSDMDMNAYERAPPKRRS